MAIAALACDGTFRPPCGRTAWTAITLDANIVHPGDANDIVVPLRLFPYVIWDDVNVACAQPSAAFLSVGLFCTAVGGDGEVIQVPTAFVPVGSVSTPGVQPLLTGPMMTPEIGGPYDFVIPAGTLPAGVDYRCEVIAQYQVTFGAGTGTGPILGLGRSATCITTASTVDATRPALELRRLLMTGEDGLLRRRRGDQALLHFLLANNEPSRGVTVYLGSTSDQLARMPGGADADGTFFAISSVKANTDNFPLRFGDVADPGTLVPEGDPLAKSVQLVGRTIYLGPGEVRIVPVLARTHGMCADGSCCHVLTEVSGEFDDGQEVVACASGALMVDSVAPEDDLWQIDDEVKVGSTTDARWSKTVFDKQAHHTTHAAGNLSKQDGGPGTQTTGSGLVSAGFPSQASDYLRLESAPDSASFSVEAFPEAENFNLMKMKVTIKNLSQASGPLAVPLLKQPDGASFKLTIDAGAGTAVLVDKKKGKKLFDGNYADLLADPPNGVFVESDTCRQFTLTAPLGQDYVSLLPGAYAMLFDDMAMPATQSVRVVDARTYTDLAWTAASDTPAVSLPGTTGNAGDALLFDISLANTATFPAWTLTWLAVISANAINVPAYLPVVTRQMSGALLPGDLDVTGLTARVLLTGEKSKDSLQIQGSVPLDVGFKPKGERVVFQIFGQDFVFELDKQGKGSGAPNTAFALSVPKNLPGDGTFVLDLAKRDFSAGFAGLDVHALSAQEVPLLADIPVLARLFGSPREASVPLIVIVTPKLVAEAALDTP